MAGLNQKNPDFNYLNLNGPGILAGQGARVVV